MSRKGIKIKLPSSSYEERCKARADSEPESERAKRDAIKTLRKVAKRIEVESTADFKARLAASLPKPPRKREDSPCVRPKGQSGFYPPPPMNDDPTKPTESSDILGCQENVETHFNQPREEREPTESPIRKTTGEQQALNLAKLMSTSVAELCQMRGDLDQCRHALRLMTESRARLLGAARDVLDDLPNALRDLAATVAEEAK